MEHIAAVLGSIAVFVGGLLVRVGMLLVFLAVVAIPVFLVLMAGRGFGILRRRALGVAHVDGLLWRRDLHYAPGHTWVRRKGTGLLVGLDDLAQRLLHGICAVELPCPGAEVREGKVATVVTCGRKHASIASPVDGVVTEVNEALGRDPTLIRRDPYVRGWLFKVAPANAHYTSLPRGTTARSWLMGEAHRLRRLLESGLGVATADGGEFRYPPSALLGEKGWEALTRAFFKTEQGEPEGADGASQPA